jgi:ribokinase
MGATTALIGAIGNDPFGHDLVSNLTACGVNAGSVLVRNAAPTGTALILLDAIGQNQIIVAGGANETLSASDMEERANVIRGSRALLAQLEVPLGAVETALALAREAGVMTFLNPAPAQPLDDALLALCDWIIPNEPEASQLTGVNVTGPSGAREAARHLRERSKGANVIVTLGAYGAWIEAGALSRLVPGFAVPVVDTVGAGDTFIGAFAASIASGAEIERAVRFASAAAALAVMRKGAQTGIPTRAEVLEFLQERNLEEGRGAEAVSNLTIP